MNKEKLIEWLKQQEEAHLKEWERTDSRFSWGKNSAFEDVREEIESGRFDKEVTPCKNATPATTE